MVHSDEDIVRLFPRTMPQQEVVLIDLDRHAPELREIHLLLLLPLMMLNGACTSRALF